MAKESGFASFTPKQSKEFIEREQKTKPQGPGSKKHSNKDNKNSI